MQIREPVRPKHHLLLVVVTGWGLAGCLLRQNEPTAVLLGELVGRQARVVRQRVEELLAVGSGDELVDAVDLGSGGTDDAALPVIGAEFSAEVEDALELLDDLPLTVAGGRENRVVLLGGVPQVHRGPASGAGVVAVGAGGLQVAHDDLVDLQLGQEARAVSADDELAVLLLVPHGEEEAVVVDERAATGVGLVVAEAVVVTVAERLDPARGGLGGHATFIAEHVIPPDSCTNRSGGAIRVSRRA